MRVALSEIAHAHPTLAALPAARSGQDLLALNLWDRDTLARLGLDGDEHAAARASLHHYQRMAQIGVAPAGADTLKARGLTSAHHVAAVPRRRFISEHTDCLGSADEAARVHDEARGIQARVTHAWARLRDQLAPHVRDNRYLQPGDELVEAVADLPSYTDLFGTLDYMKVPECQSVLGPSAYFVDLMRVIEETIVAENPGIADAYKLATRRPDMFSTPLTCANALDPVSKVAIINEVISKRLSGALGADTDYAIATRVFPFFLPQNLHLLGLRATLGIGGQSLASVYEDFLAQDGGSADMPQPVDVASELLALSSEQRAIVVTADTTADTLAQYYGLPAGSDAPSPIALATDLGEVSVAKDQLAMTGSGFTDAVVGWVVNVGGTLRVINSVDSATTISVDTPWPADQTGVAAQAYPPQSVAQLAVFSKVTGIDTPGVCDLLSQNLSPDEIAAGLAGRFYINATGGGAPVAVLSDLTDANYSLDLLTGLSLDRLDRINRFLRLAASCAWPLADLDWAIACAAGGNLDEAALPQLALLARLQERLSLSLDEACGLFATVKTYGRGSDVRPLDLFDRVFNVTRVLEDGSPYRPRYADNPLFTSDPIEWSPNADDGDSRRVLAWLAGALRLSEADVRQLAAAVGGPAPILLDVPRLSRFYALARLARALKLKFPALMQAIELLGDGIPGTLEAVAALVAFKDAADQAGLSLDDIGYITNGPVLGKLPGALDPQTIPSFLSTLRTLGKAWLLEPHSFVFDNIDPERSANLFKAFVKAGCIDANGVVLLSSPPQFGAVAPLFPVTVKALQVRPLTQADAEQAHAELNANGILADNVLTAEVTPDTDLSFLFPGDPKQKSKIDAVQDVLLQASGDIVHTIAVVGDALGEQLLGIYTQLSLLYEDEVEMAQAVTSLTLGELGVPQQILLTPPTDIGAVVDALVNADRLAYAAGKLGIEAADMETACLIPVAFGFVDLAHPNLKDLYLLATYARLIRAFSTTGFMIAGYLMAPMQPPYVKLQSLQVVTGWPVEQSAALIEALWGSNEGFNSLPGLDRMRVCFNSADNSGVELESMLALASSARYPRMPLPTFSGGDASAWARWARLAQSALDMLKAKYGDAAWAEMSRPAVDAVAANRRDALVALAVLLLRPDISMIDSPQGLSEYLLMDVESGSCNTTTPILELTLAAQMYLQRCRMALEPGVTSAEISDLTWSWMSSYRLWEANRKVFIYPESYIDPTLRRARTPLFSTLLEQLQQGEITDAAVTSAFTQYLTSLDELAKLQTVGSVYCTAPDPDTGELVDQLIMVGRTADEPFGYYLRTMEDGVIWSAWHKIDLKIPAPNVTPVHAFGRLFLFWVETEEASIGLMEGTSQENVSSLRGSIRYSYQRLDKTWTAPQPVLSGIVFDAMPDTYSTSLLSTNSDDPLSGIDVGQPYWYRPYVTVVPDAPGMSERLVVAFGNAYEAKTTSTLNPPDRNDPAADRLQLNESVYNASRVANAVPAGTPGSVQLLPVAVLDDTLSISEAWAFFQDHDGAPQPFGATAYENTFRLIPSQNVLIDNMLSEGSDYYERVYAGGVTTSCLYSLSRQAQVIGVANMPGWWVFDNGDEAFLAVTTEVTFKQIEKIVSMAPNALSLADGPDEVSLSCAAYSDEPINVQDAVVQFTRLSTGAVGHMNRALFSGGIEALLSNATQVAPGPGSLCFTRFYSSTPNITATCEPQGGGMPPPPNTIPPDVLCGGQVDFKGAYRPYFEEVFFHIPFLLATMLSANQRFAEAQRWYDFVFDPTAAVQDPDAPQPAVFWQFQPFREDTSMPSLSQELSDNAAILRWNKHPFDPYSVADLRPSAFRKTMVMHYIDNLLDWGDAQFALDTRESLNQALLLYLMAYDLLGPRPRERGTMPTPAPLNFQDILDTYGDDIPQFLIELETALPPAPPARFQYNPAPFNLMQTYFGVGENADLVAYWSRIEDRLYKLRHCMNLAGVVRQLPFYQPPIDPNALVAAVARNGGQLPEVMDHSPAAAPNYRFRTMLERAKSLTQTLIGFGGSLLAALEKKDAEALALLQNVQERAVLSLGTQMKEQQVIDAEQSLAGLQTSYASAVYRQNYYANLIDEGLSPAEEVNIAMMALANVFQTQSGVMRAMSSAAHLIPNAGSPFAMTYGGIQIGFAFDAASAIFDTISRNFDFASSLSSVLAGYQRRSQEWSLQAQLAGYEASQQQSQIAAAQARVTMAQRDLQLNGLQISQADDTERFLTEKFTNAELYNWMSSRLSTLYFQTYKLAFELAMAAQRAYQYEMDSDATFVDFRYWDSGRKGLLAGEGLLLGLSQMESSFLSGNTRRLSISKTVSLRDLNPKALLDLQNTGTCSFGLSELLFDLDYPGHYCRRIQGLKVTVPSVVGPYQDLHGLLTQTSNTILMKDDPEAVAFLLGEETSTPVDGALRLNWRGQQQIAVSRAIDDDGAGVESGEDRYAPFEGTGAVSQWQLDMPQRNNGFDLGTISDVILQIDYTAQAGGPGFRKTVTDMLPTDIAGGRLLELSQYTGAWYAFMNPAADDTVQTLQFRVPRNLFPFNIDGAVSLSGAYLQLVVEHTTFVGPMPVTLSVPGEADPTPLTFAKDTISVATSLDVELDATANWVLQVKRSDIPAELKLGDRLDPARLVGIYLVLTFSGQVA
ncbi:hypothetical protein FKV24_006010 [Lysobacter maris]|uniref:Toxin n=1 Tax=Marilutibacter maris TaxID=1605891 RepID=A0A508AVB7_9GAMM|nr:hypothetical protein FKV24_006010 [Lysobacter maris]